MHTKSFKINDFAPSTSQFEAKSTAIVLVILTSIIGFFQVWPKSVTFLCNWLIFVGIFTADWLLFKYHRKYLTNSMLKDKEEQREAKTEFRTIEDIASGLNNFYMLLPAGFYRTNLVASLFEDQETYAKCIERHFTCRSGVDLDLKGYSEKKLSQTPSEFFATIDRAIEDSGLDMGAIKTASGKIYRASLRGDFHSKSQWLLALNKLIVPIYIKLRKLGYSHRDLVA